jgi:iron only hydrogenase large subunit-like protein
MGSDNNKKYKVYAVVAPAIASQFDYSELGKVISAIKELGFYKVHEAALGADMVALTEAQELIEKGFLTSTSRLTRRKTLYNNRSSCNRRSWRKWSS